nr:hypothetical protein JVH1_6843 [Rhodococcus sp. JVH1]
MQAPKVDTGCVNDNGVRAGSGRDRRVSRKVGGHRVILRESYQFDSTKERAMTAVHNIDYTSS